MHSFSLLAIGNAIMDFTSVCDDIHKIPACVKLGSFTHVPFSLINDYVLNNSNVIISTGGAAANVSKIVAMLGLSATFVGVSGQDERGSLYEAMLKENGVCLAVDRVEGSTGMCLTLLNRAGVRTVLANPGVSILLNEKKIYKSYKYTYDVVYFEGYLMYDFEMLTSAIAQAFFHNHTIALDLASASFTNQYRYQLFSLITKHVSYVFMNEEIFKTLFSVKEFSSEILCDIIPKNNQIYWIITLGSKGSICYFNDEIFFAEAGKNSVFDESGAGDAFAAAFLSTIFQGYNIIQSLKSGNRVAGYVTEVAGTNIDKTTINSIYSNSIAL